MDSLNAEPELMTESTFATLCSTQDTSVSLVVDASEESDLAQFRGSAWFVLHIGDCRSVPRYDNYSGSTLVFQGS